MPVDPRAKRQLDKGVGDEAGRERDHMVGDEDPQQDNRAQLHLTARGPRKDEHGHPTRANHT